VTNREIRRRISSVKETVKITKAMHVISAAKMIAVKSQLSAAATYHEQALRVLSAFRPAFQNAPFFAKRGERVGYLVIFSAKGLCGDYNALMLEKALQESRSQTEKYVFTLGKSELLRKAGVDVDVEYLRSADTFRAAGAIADDLLSLYENDLLDEVKVISADGNATVNVVVTPLLPVMGGASALAEIEPRTQESLRLAVRNYLASSIRILSLKASLAEHTSRARAMSQSTDNAEKMIEDLTVRYNRGRQESITRALQDVSIADREV